MSSVSKTIENPEVPGLERLLPPPPPPPPPPVISESGAKEALAAKPAAAPPVLSAAVDAAADKTVLAAESKVVVAAAQPPPPPPSAAAVTAAVAFPAGSPGLFPGAMHAPYFMQPAMPQVPPGVEQPWWVPTDSDTTDGGAPAAANRPWIDQSAPWTEPPGTTPKVVSPGKVAKGKFFKRKSECIDPAQDAERVASAQRELSALMKPLKCDLCNAIMNSTLQAKLHYEGKPHQKKVSMFLNQSVKKIKPDDGQVTSTTSSTDWNTYCDVCKTWFTSQIDASQHYAGKKHIRATTGVTRQKTKKPQSQTPVDPTGRFGIGMPFSAEPQVTILGSPEIAPPAPAPAVAAPPPPVAPPAAAFAPPAWPFPAFRCDLCGVTANRLEQLETHKRGAKHMKTLKMSGLATTEPEEVNDSSTQATLDYSIYRTPSGQYYCAPCNRSFHSENAFAQHVESKKHKTQVNPKQAPPAPVPTKKANKATK